MATIALIRCITILTKQGTRLNQFFTVKVTTITCGLLWILVFVMLAPTTFGAEGFGSFQYMVSQGRCEMWDCDDQEVIAWYYLIIHTVPCLIIITSYIGISTYIYVKTKRNNCTLADSRESRVNRTLLILCVSYLAFTLPLSLMEFGLLDAHLEPGMAAYWDQVILAWYWWIFGTNFFIYVSSTPVFRNIIRLFLGEMALKLGATSMAGRVLPVIQEVS